MYESDFDKDALSRLLRTSRTVSLSVEKNHFNSLVQRMMEPAPFDIYVLQEYERLETIAEIKSFWMEFFNYLLCVHAFDSTVISTVNLAKLIYYQTSRTVFPCIPLSQSDVPDEPWGPGLPP